MSKNFFLPHLPYVLKPNMKFMVDILLSILPILPSINRFMPLTFLFRLLFYSFTLQVLEFRFYYFFYISCTFYYYFFFFTPNLQTVRLELLRDLYPAGLYMWGNTYFLNGGSGGISADVIFGKN
jgi:hypothetical protein